MKHEFTEWPESLKRVQNIKKVAHRPQLELVYKAFNVTSDVYTITSQSGNLFLIRFALWRLPSYHSHNRLLHDDHNSQDKHNNP